MNDIMICAHLDQPASDDVCGLLRYAYDMTAGLDARITVLAFGTKLDDRDCALLGTYGADFIRMIETAAVFESDGMLAALLAEEIRAQDPAAVLFSATDETRILASQTAALLGTGLTADCSDLAYENGLLLQTRPAFGGNLMATIVCPDRRPQMATVHPGRYAGVPLDCPKEPAKVIRNASDIPGKVTCLSIQTYQTDSLIGVDTILCGGMGLDAAAWTDLRALCEKTGARLGATRAAVNNNLAPYACQIGQTGRTARAKRYIAFGVSGAVQHLSGIRTCGEIIAVNNDPKAPFRDQCDLFIEADAPTLIRALLASEN